MIQGISFKIQMHLVHCPLCFPQQDNCYEINPYQEELLTKKIDSPNISILFEKKLNISIYQNINYYAEYVCIQSA